MVFVQLSASSRRLDRVGWRLICFFESSEDVSSSSSSTSRTIRRGTTGTTRGFFRTKTKERLKKRIEIIIWLFLLLSSEESDEDSLFSLFRYYRTRRYVSRSHSRKRKDLHCGKLVFEDYFPIFPNQHPTLDNGNPYSNIPHTRI